MDFLFRLPRMPNGIDGIWVIIDKLTKTALSLPIKVTFPFDRLDKLYVDWIVCSYGVSVSIVSDCEPSFISKF